MLQIFASFPILMFHKVVQRVATRLRCGGTLNDSFVAYLLVNLSVKKIENLSTFSEVVHNIIVACFLTHSVVYQPRRPNIVQSLVGFR